MIHNQYVELIQQFLSDYNKELYGRELIDKVKMSQKSIALALNDLEKNGILKSRKSGNIKYFSLNKKNPETKDAILSAEVAKKIDFFRKHRIIANILTKDDRTVGIFGSYSSGTQKEDSDLDVFIIGKRTNNDYKKKGEKFDININPVYFDPQQFIKLSKEKNNLIKEIIRNHILIFNAEKFIELAWREFYGLN